MPTVSVTAVRKQIAAAAPDLLYLLQGEDEVDGQPARAYPLQSNFR